VTGTPCCISRCIDERAARGSVKLANRTGRTRDQAVDSHAARIEGSVVVGVRASRLPTAHRSTRTLLPRFARVLENWREEKILVALRVENTGVEKFRDRDLRPRSSTWAAWFHVGLFPRHP
jgi:hypothetical protein